MINVLFIIIFVIIILIASIMMIPFHITLNLGNFGLEFNGYFKITWMRISIFKRDIPSKEEKKEEKPKRKEKVKAEWNLERIFKVFNLFLDAMPYLRNILYTFFRSITLVRLKLDFKMGMDSPVDTAELAGFFWSLSPIINLIPRVSFNMSPVFMKTTLEGNLEVELKIKLLWIVFESLKAITKKPVRNLINEVRA